jgi:hypothetical protein
MKKQELFNIICKGRIIYKDISQEDVFEIMDELAQQFYETGLPNPEDLVVECVSISDN